MTKNPGVILQLLDGRLFIVYQKQPLLKDKNRIMLHHCDDDYNTTGKLKLMDVPEYHQELKKAKKIGYVD